MTEGPADLQAACAPDGRVWFYSSFGNSLGLWRCEGEDCARVVTRRDLGLRGLARRPARRLR